MRPMHAAFCRRGCDWVGNTIRPHAIQPRAAADVTPLTQEEWYDSVEMHAVRTACCCPCHTMQVLLAQLQEQLSPPAL